MQALAAAAHPKAQKAAETRARLIAIARRLFASQGYASTGTEAVVLEAGVTRGALYFHFADKAALFEAVLDAVAREVAGAIAAASAGASSALDGLALGTRAYLHAATDASRRRIYLIDGPAVLGAARWHELENRYSRPLLIEGLAALGVNDPDAMAHLLSGAMIEGANWLSVDETIAPRLESAFATLFAALAR